MARDLADYATRLTQLLCAIERQAEILAPTGDRAEVEVAKAASASAKAAVVVAEGEARSTNKAFRTVEITPTEDARAVVKVANRAAINEAKKEESREAKVAGAGYLPLRLRARHSLTATWLNIAVQVNGWGRRRAIAMGADNYGRLVTLLETAKELEEPGQDAFLDEMSRVACALKRAFDPFVKGLSASELPDPPRFRNETSLESPHVLYDDSCRLAVMNTKEALAALELAAGLEDNRTDARTDPWFERIRSLPDPADGSRAKTVRRFWEIVGAPPSFTELHVFGTKGADLAAVGVTSAAQLFDATGTDDERKDMAKVLDVPLGVVTAWRNLAELAEPKTTPGEWLTPRQLNVLLSAGIRSLKDLKVYVTSPADWSALQTRVEGKAEEAGVAPLDATELRAVALRA
jgi:hypothetical protein